MWDDRSFDSRSFDERSWLRSLVQTIREELLMAKARIMSLAIIRSFTGDSNLKEAFGEAIRDTQLEGLFRKYWLRK